MVEEQIMQPVFPAICSKTKFMELLGIKDATFKTLIDAGMPARFENGRWYISMNNFQVWFDNWTAVRPAVDGDDYEYDCCEG